MASSLGKLPEKRLNDKSTYWRLVRFAMATGIGPLRLFPDIILYSPVKKQREIVRTMQVP